jgi:anaerobic magnesium-protoporphyrin IX monomethyl ester cyclase
MRWQDTGRGGTMYYPVWLAYATGLLEEQFDTRLVDAPVWNWDMERVLEDIKQYSPDLVAVDTSFPTLTHDISISETIKAAYSEVKTVMVGAPTSQFPEKILASRGIDFVARWEYDFTLKELAEILDRGGDPKTIKGISYKDEGGIIHNPDREFTTSEDLDKIPFVSKVYKKHLNIRDYFLGYSLSPEVQIFASRGCPFQCIFCSWTQTFTGRKFRVRSVSNVIDELVWIQDNLPDVKEVFFEDDTFTIDKKWVRSFCDEYKIRNLDLQWACQARADVDYEIMRKMKEANCRVMVVGFESGSDEVLKNMKKGITLQQSKQFISDARKAGMPVHGNYVIGLPGETEETIEMTKKLIREAKSEAITVAVTTPFPGTELYEWTRTNGYLLTDNPDAYLDREGHQRSIISYPWLSAEEITETVDRILKEYFLSLKYIPLALKRIWGKKNNRWGEVKRLLFSAKAFLKYISKKVIKR